MASEDDINWIVPLRRAVVKRTISYREFLQLWIKTQLRDATGMRLLLAWYEDNEAEGKDFAPVEYVKGLRLLRLWMEATFEGATAVTTNPIGTTTLQTYVPNFHARLWKGPKRVLLEQRAQQEPEHTEDLAALRPFELEGGRIRLLKDEQGKPRDFELLVGDVLEIALHEFLAACGQRRFEDIEFDPMGSFYLGTTVRSKSGQARTKLPQLHDNMLAMRFQLVTALNMANCYHDEPVYAADYMASVSKSQIKPEGGGVYARGMPYGGNASSPLQSRPTRWRVSQVHTNVPEIDRPIYLPDWPSMARLVPGLPLTWGWVCTPWMVFLFNYMMDFRETSDGRPFPADFRGGGSFAASVTLSASEANNAKMLQKVRDFQCPKKWERIQKGQKANDVACADIDLDPLVTFELQPHHVTWAPRENAPMADYFTVLTPEGKQPKGRPFTDLSRLRALPKLERPEAKKKSKKKPPAPVESYKLDELCAGASLICVSSGGGHEFGIVKLYSAQKLFQEAKNSLFAEAGSSMAPPHAGRIAAYHPLTGEDICEELEDGRYFVYESAARLLPTPGRDEGGKKLFDRSNYKPLQLAEVRIHKFKPVLDDSVRFTLNDDDKLLIDEDGGDFRKKAVSSIFYVDEGDERDNEPKSMAAIYRAPRESWPAIELRLPSSRPKPAVKALLADHQKLYAERAVPFPTILEVAEGLPSHARVQEQLNEHKQHILGLMASGKHASLKNELSALDVSIAAKEAKKDDLSKDEKKQLSKEKKRRKEISSDLAIIENDALRAAILKLLP